MNSHIRQSLAIGTIFVLGLIAPFGAGARTNCNGYLPGTKESSIQRFWSAASEAKVRACMERFRSRSWTFEPATPLHLAVQYSADPAIVRALLRAGADPNAKFSPSGIRALLEPDAGHHEWAPNGTSLHLAAEHSADPAIVRALLRAGADPNATARGGFTPLHAAVRYSDDPAIISTLLQAGADPNAKTDGGHTPLHVATEYSADPAIVKALLEAGAEPNAKSRARAMTVSYDRLNQTVADYKIVAAADDSGLEYELNLLAEDGFRFHSILQHSPVLQATVEEEVSNQRINSILRENAKTMAIMVNGFQANRYSYRVVSAYWTGSRPDTAEQLEEYIGRKMNDILLNKLQKSAEDGFYPPIQSMHFPPHITDNSKVLLLRGVRVILQKDNMNEDRTDRSTLGPFKALIAVRAGTMERKLNEASKNNFQLQAVTAAARDSSIFSNTILTKINPIVSILMHDESRKSEYRVIRGSTNIGISLPGIPGGEKTEQNLNALSAEGFRYVTQISSMGSTHMIFQERAADGPHIEVQGGLRVVRVPGRELEFVPISSLINMLNDSSRRGFRLLGVSQELEPAVFVIFARR